MLQSKQRLLELNAKFADTLTSKGVTATSDETTTALVNKVANITSGDAIYFSNDGRTYIKNIILPEGLTEIGNYAFCKCVNLESVKIPYGVTNIAGYAFQNCNSLTDINIPDGVTSIGSYAFQNCNSLTDINIPDGVTNIGFYAFQNCNSLTDINIPGGVKVIGMFTLSGCINLKKCIIGHGVNNIGWESFSKCDNLEVLFLPNTINEMHTYCYITSSLKLKEVVLEDGFNYSLNFPSQLLEREIVVNMFNALADRTGLDTLYFAISKVVGNKLTDEDKAIPVSKNWTLVEK